MMKNKIILSILLLSCLTWYSCDDDLDIPPLSEVAPEDYLWDELHLAAYTVNRYDASLSINGNRGAFAGDDGTDTQAGMSMPKRFIAGEYKVDQKGGSWGFGEIYHINYFLNTVLPRHEAGKITGEKQMIEHYIGEMYFFRAHQYFNKLSALGDFPIVTTNFEDKKDVLIEASKRMPRTEVARFIISDLDKAISLMKAEAPDGKKNRISIPVAQLLKSRVALFEGTWLKYFKNTPFVPNGPGWIGASKDYNKDYQFQAGSIDAEINWFLDQAISAADAVASTTGLTANTGILPQGLAESNPFVEMYGAIDMSGYDEVLLWKAYSKGLKVNNNFPVNASTSNDGIGITRGMIDSYLMQNGLPYYASGSNYKGDESIHDVKSGRDHRAMLFVKEPNQINMWINIGMGTHGVIKEPFLPNITSGTVQFRYNTGYTSRKGVNPDEALCVNYEGYNGYIVFRAAEAYLNYIEAHYERHGTLDGKAENYWKALRHRAAVSDDIQKTINATDMAMESRTNWAAYSAGELVDQTLYNIRRERGCELMGEGYRLADLKRWRAMDQMIKERFFVEGFKIWGDYYKQQYEEAGKVDGTYKLIYGISNSSSNVSSPELSNYLRPYQAAKTLAYDGYTWRMAHYLSPIAIQHFKITSNSENYDDSPIYQNPYWPLLGDEPAEK